MKVTFPIKVRVISITPSQWALTNSALALPKSRLAHWPPNWSPISVKVCPTFAVTGEHLRTHKENWELVNFRTVNIQRAFRFGQISSPPFIHPKGSPQNWIVLANIFKSLLCAFISLLCAEKYEIFWSIRQCEIQRTLCTVHFQVIYKHNYRPFHHLPIGR